MKGWKQSVSQKKKKGNKGAWNPKQRYEKGKNILVNGRQAPWYIVGKKKIIILIKWKWVILACLHQQHLEVASLQFQFQEQMFFHYHEPETKEMLEIYANWWIITQ